MPNNIKIMIITHRPAKLLIGKYYINIHAGRAIARELSKDGKLSKDDYDWLINNTIGDDIGDNISAKNRYYSECSALYWSMKNYVKLGNPDYIGLMHYRRHFIFNEEYYDLKNNKSKWEKALGYVRENFIDNNYLIKTGLTDSNIEKYCNEYDLIVSKDSDLSLIHNRNLREDYEKTIPGANVKDFDLMIDIIKNKYPEYSEVIDKNINGYKKSMYQMFIMKKFLFFEYCELLFDILNEAEKEIDFKNYTINGKRSLGYLAELILSIYVWKKTEENYRIKKLGVTLVDFPYEDNYIKTILEKGCPKYSDYLKCKISSLFMNKKDKRAKKEEYQGIRRKRRDYKKLKELYILKEGINNG